MREHHWPPDVIGKMYIDDLDHRGLLYWYNDIDQVTAEMKQKQQR